MERLVCEKNTAAYQIADQEERITRRTETDVIKEFVEYARAQGSTHADHYYSNYTRLAYKSVGITDKTTAAGSQLDDLSLVEHLIAHTLRTAWQQDVITKIFTRTARIGWKLSGIYSVRREMFYLPRVQA